MQRQWIGLSISGDEVSVEQLPQAPHPSAPCFLQSIDLEIGFMRRGYESSEQFNADDMASTFVKAFNRVVMAVDEILVFEFHGHNLKAIVKSVALAELAAKQQRGVATQLPELHNTMGVVMENTDVTFMKSGTIKIKSSAKK
jgi:vesicle-fusing ATPase